MLERHRAILDEGNGLPRLLHRHHDVEARGAHVGDRRLQSGIEHLDDAAPVRPALVPAEAEVTHQSFEPLQARKVLLPVVLGEFHEQHRVRRAAHELLERRTEQLDLACEPDHGAIDKLDRDRPELHDVLGRIHGFVEAAEMADAHGAPGQHRPELEFDPGRECQRAFGTDEQMREIDLVLARHQRVEIIAADPALHLRKARLDLARLARADGEQILRKRLERRIRRQVREIRRNIPETRDCAVGKHRVDREHVVAHHAVAQRAAAAGIVPRHAADGRARRGGDVDRKPQPVRLERAVQIVEHDAGLDHAAPARNIELENAREALRAIDHQRLVHRLPGLRRAAAARQYRDAFGPRHRDRLLGLVHALRDHDAHWHKLVGGGVGRVTAAVEVAEQHLAHAFALQAALQPRHQAHCHQTPPPASNAHRDAARA